MEELKIPKVYNAFANSWQMDKATAHDRAVEALARAKERERQLAAAGKLERIETRRGVFYASGRYIDMIRNANLDEYVIR